MSDDTPTSSSRRVMLALLAQQTVTDTAGVTLTAGEHGRWVTVDRHQRIAGVTAAAQADGRIEVGLYLEVSWPPEPLHRLAEDLRGRVRSAADREHLAGDLGEVLITIAGVNEVDEPGVIA